MQAENWTDIQAGGKAQQKNKRNHNWLRSSVCFWRGVLLFALIAVASHEFFDATSSIDDAFLTRIERMGEGTDFDLDDVVLDAVDRASLIALHGGNAPPLVVAVHKQHGVVNGVGIGFHETSLAKRSAALYYGAQILLLQGMWDYRRSKC